MKILLVFALVAVAVALASPLQDSKTDKNKDSEIDELTALLEKLKTAKKSKISKPIVGASSGKKNAQKKTLKIDLDHDCEDYCDEDDREKRTSKQEDCDSWCDLHDALDTRMKQVHKKSAQKLKTITRNEKINKLKSMLDKMEKKTGEKDGDSSQNDVFDESEMIGSCNTTALGLCTIDLWVMFEDLPLLQYPVSDSDVDEICSALDDADACVRGGSGCDSPDNPAVKQYWLGVQGSLSYVCADEGRTELKGYQQCLTDNAQAYGSEIEQCLEGLPALPDDEDLTEQDICTLLTELRDCLGTAARDNCDSEVFVDNYFNLGANPELESFLGCSLGKRASKKAELLKTLKSLLKMIE